MGEDERAPWGPAPGLQAPVHLSTVSFLLSWSWNIPRPSPRPGSPALSTPSSNLHPRGPAPTLPGLARLSFSQERHAPAHGLGLASSLSILSQAPSAWVSSRLCSTAWGCAQRAEVLPADSRSLHFLGLCQEAPAEDGEGSGEAALPKLGALQSAQRSPARPGLHPAPWALSSAALPHSACTRTHTAQHTHTHTCAHTCTHASKHTYVLTDTYTYTCAHTSHMHTNTQAQNTHVHTRTQKYTCIHTR